MSGCGDHPTPLAARRRGGGRASRALADQADLGRTARLCRRPVDPPEQLVALWEANGRPDLDDFAEGFIGWLRAMLPLYAQEMEPK